MIIATLMFSVKVFFENVIVSHSIGFHLIKESARSDIFFGYDLIKDGDGESPRLDWWVGGESTNNFNWHEVPQLGK